MSRRPWRGVDTDPGWINRKFKDLETQIRQLAAAKRLEASSVGGGVVTIREILTNPAGQIRFRNVDVAVAIGPGTMMVLLTYVPLDGSLHVYWEGLAQRPSEWTLDGHFLTLDDADGHLAADDEIAAAYSYDPSGTPLAWTLVQTLMVDSESSVAAVGPVLNAGEYYKIEVRGTWSYRPGAVVLGAAVPLLYDSPGGGSGIAYIDAEWVYGSSYSGDSGYSFPVAVPAFGDGSAGLRWRHGSAGSYHLWTPTTTSPDPDYTYSRIITGQGQAIQLSVSDAILTDNDGQFRVNVYAQS